MSYNIFLLTIEHLWLAFSATILATITGIIIGLIIYRIRIIAPLILGIIEVLQTVPNLAMLAIVMFFFGLGNTTLIIVLIVYGLMPIIRNTYTSFINTDKEIIESGIGMGMTQWQLFRYVQLPLALPVIISGIQVTATATIGIATIGPLIGAGGLGQPIWRGMQISDTPLILSGAIPAALLAIVINFAITKLKDRITPWNLKIETHT